jgi:hypothetical protein
VEEPCVAETTVFAVAMPVTAVMALRIGSVVSWLIEVRSRTAGAMRREPFSTSSTRTDRPSCGEVELSSGRIEASGINAALPAPAFGPVPAAVPARPSLSTARAGPTPSHVEADAAAVGTPEDERAVTGVRG